MNAPELYQGKPVIYEKGTSEEWERVYQKNVKEMERIDRAAKASGFLAGRFIHYPVADGSACYQIIRVNAKTCRIRWCPLGDDNYMVLAWGHETTIPLATAQQLTGRFGGSE